MMNNFLSENPQKGLITFSFLCENELKINSEFIYNTAMQAIFYYRADKKNRKILKKKQKLENIWYNALDKGEIDYSVYDTDEYIGDLWACWLIYSRKYLKDIQNKKSLFGKSIIDDLEQIKIIVDLGCGFGYTTASLKQLFPKAEVFGTNLENTIQMKMCKILAKIYHFSMITNIKEITRKVDLIFASEYFEHILNPIDHLIELLEILQPRNLLIANAFGITSIGHFRKYIFNEKEYSGKEISKIFNKTLKNFGYQKIKTKLWNNRPNYWKKIEDKTD